MRCWLTRSPHFSVPWLAEVFACWLTNHVWSFGSPHLLRSYVGSFGVGALVTRKCLSVQSKQECANTAGDSESPKEPSHCCQHEAAVLRLLRRVVCVKFLPARRVSGGRRLKPPRLRWRRVRVLRRRWWCAGRLPHTRLSQKPEPEPEESDTQLDDTAMSSEVRCQPRERRRRRRQSLVGLLLMALAAAAALSREGSRVLTGQRVDLEHDFVAVVTEESLSGCTAQVRHGQWSYLHSARVGEATHPGPAGSRRTRRLRASKEFAQQDWDPWVAARVGEATNPGPKPGSCSEDGLACALLEVLKNYQAQAPAPVSVPRQSALKPQVPAQSSLALVLHSVLEAAVNNAWDDSKVAERVSANILTWQKQRHQAVGAPESNSHARRVSFSDSPVGPRSPRTEGLEAPKGKGKGKGKLPSNSNPGCYPTAAKPPKPVPHKPQAKAKNRKALFPIKACRVSLLCLSVDKEVLGTRLSESFAPSSASRPDLFPSGQSLQRSRFRQLSLKLQ